MYLLLDANIVIGYYMPRGLNHPNLKSRIRNLVDSVRSESTNHFLYIPNFCIAEVFSVFAKHSFGKYNQHVKKAGGTIDTRVYESLCKQFQSDIHNGKLFYQLELNRYHILGIDLVSPIDHYFKIQKKQKYARPAGTFDQLLVSMSVHLAHVHGQDNVAIITADTRLAQLVDKCRSKIPSSTVKRLKLDRAHDVAGKKFSANLFPRVVHFGKAKDSELKGIFGNWPLEMPKVKGRGVYTFDK